MVDLERTYTRRGWGRRKLVHEHLVARATSSPSQIGEVLATVGHDQVLKKVDARRGKVKGTSYKELDELTKRRNAIAHSGDRKGTGRAHIQVGVVERHVARMLERSSRP